MTDLDHHQRELAALRQVARQELERIADVLGRDAALLARCRDAWRQRESDAAASLLHGDAANAAVILERGVHALRHALAACRRERLPLEELYALLIAC